MRELRKFIACFGIGCIVSLILGLSDFFTGFNGYSVDYPKNLEDFVAEITNKPLGIIVPTVVVGLFVGIILFNYKRKK